MLIYSKEDDLPLDIEPAYADYLRVVEDEQKR
jgi:hypothetical protein